MIASTTLWWRERSSTANPLVMRQLHLAAATAWLRNDQTAALAAATTLTQQAPGEAGAWRLLELIAGSAGKQSMAQRADRRASQLEAAAL